MKILILGATGMIGSRIVTESLTRGHDVISASRSAKPDDRENVLTISLDINDTKNLQQTIESVDIVVAAVSPRNGGNQTEEAEAFTNSLINAVGKTRLILVGGAGSLLLKDGTPVLNVIPEEYKSEGAAMLAAYEKLNASDTNFTVLAPAAVISPGERTGKARVGDRTLVTDAGGKSEISAEDYAVVLLDEVETPHYPRAIFNAAY